MRATFLRIFKQMINDKRSLMLILFAPILIMTFMYLIFSDHDYTATLALKGVPLTLQEALKKQDVTLIDLEKNTDQILLDHDADAVLIFDQGKLILRLREPDGTKAAAVTKALNQALKSMNPNATDITMSFIYGSSEKSVFDSLGYVFLGVFSFFFVFLIAGISFIRERTLGTMERFMLTPISRKAAVAGFLMGYGLFAVLQSILLVLVSKFVLNMAIEGSLMALIILMTLLSFVALAMGAVVSVFANNEFQVVQFIPVVIVPQIFFSGLIAVDTLPFHLDKLAYFMPVYYACNGLKKVMVEGAGLWDVLPEIGILCLIIAGLFALNVRLLKRYRVL